MGKFYNEKLKKTDNMKKQLLFLMLTLCSSFIFSQSPPSYIPTNGLVGWWPFTGNANDLSVNANNGTITSGVTLTTDRFGNSNSAYSFDGSGDYIDCGNSASVNFRNSFTISAWLYATDLSFPRGIVTKSAIGNAYALVAGPYNLSDLNFLGINTGYLVPTLNWVHVTSIFDSTARTISLYTNGVLYGTQNVSYDSISVSPDNLYLGTHRPLFTPDWTWSGKLDDIGIWNRALTVSEISQVYVGPTIGIENLQADKKISIYPNPTNDFVFIKADKKISGQKYFITDSFGRQVLSGQFSNENSGIDLSSLATGIYFLQVNSQIIKLFKN
jgi:hypothetical protein